MAKLLCCRLVVTLTIRSSVVMRHIFQKVTILFAFPGLFLTTAPLLAGDLQTITISKPKPPITDGFHMGDSRSPDAMAKDHR